MSVYEIPDCHIDHRPHTNLPGNGTLFTMLMSRWLTEHLDRVTVGEANGKVCVCINDPVTEMSFRALGMSAECY
jgi:hypothetical protein